MSQGNVPYKDQLKKDLERKESISCRQRKTLELSNQNIIICYFSISQTFIRVDIILTTRKSPLFHYILSNSKEFVLTKSTAIVHAELGQCKGVRGPLKGDAKFSEAGRSLISWEPIHPSL